MKFNMEYYNSCTNKCQKFEPNVFNKSKCQACFKGKDEHSAQALENNKISRKILLCDYYFVAPSSFNFDNPMDRTRRWQRRLFVLYDDGELTYSIDENVNTVPQGAINIGTSQEISDAEEITAHQFSIVVVAQDGTRTFIKGSSKEETERLRGRLKGIVEGVKPVKVKRNFTISHSPSSALERKLAHSTDHSGSGSGSLRNHFLSHPSLSLPVKSSKSRVLSEISNRALPTRDTGVAQVQKNDSMNISMDVVDSAADSSRESPQKPPSYRNLRRLKSKTQDKVNSNFRKSLSLQTLSDGTSSDIDGDILASNSPTRNNQNAEEQHLSPPDLFLNLPENAPNVTVRSSRSKKKYRKFGKKENADRLRSRSLCHEREQFPKGGSVLGAIRFWEERSKSCEAPKFRRNCPRSHTVEGVPVHPDPDSSDSCEKVPHRSRNASRRANLNSALLCSDSGSTETLKDRSYERLAFDELSLDDIVLHNSDYQLLVANPREHPTAKGQTVPDKNFLSDFLDQSLSRSSSLKSIGPVDSTTKEDHWNADNQSRSSNSPLFASSSPVSTTTPRIPNCMWPYSSSFSPDSNSSLEGRKGREGRRSLDLGGVEEHEDVKQKLEEAQNKLLNKQNIISVVMSQLSGLVSPSTTALRDWSNCNQYSLSEVEEVLRKLNESIGRTNLEKTELEASLQRAERRNSFALSSTLKDLKVQNDLLASAMADRETLIRQLKTDLEESAGKIRARDSANENLEKNLQQLKMSLKTSEIRRGMLERRNSEIMEEVADHNNSIRSRENLNPKRMSVDGSPSCCMTVRSERDSLLQVVGELRNEVSNLEKDLTDEKMCRESARKSFLKELADHKNRAEEDRKVVKNLQEDIEHLKADRTNALSALNERNTKISLLSGDLSKVEQELREALSQNDELTSLFRESEQQTKDLTMTLDSQSKRILTLEADMGKLLSENEELNHKLDFSMAEKCCLSEELERLAQEFEAHREQVEDQMNNFHKSRSNSDEVREIARLNEYVGELEHHLENHRKSLEELKFDHQKKVLQLECQAGELLEKLKASEKEKISLRDKKLQMEVDLKQLSATCKEFEGNFLAKERHSKGLEKQLSDLKARRLPEESNEAMSTKSRSAEMLSDQSKTSELEKANSALKQQLRKLEVDLEDARSSSSVKVQELSRKLDLEQRRCSRFCDSLRKLGGDDRSESLPDHLETLIDELETTRTRLQEMEERADRLQTELENSELGKRSVEDGVSESVESSGDVFISDAVVVGTPECVDSKSLEALEETVRQLELQLRNIQDDHQHELAVQRAAHRRELTMSREETLRKLADAEANCLPINEDSIRKKYSKDVNKIKEMYNKGFHTLEKSQQQTIAELKRSHVIEMERLQLEKEQLLKEEVAATQAALDAMKKAHEAELEKERQKFIDKLSQTYSITDMKALQKKHEEDVKFIEVEIRQLSEQYSIKCLENAAVGERLKQQTTSLHENRKRVQDLLARNEELVSHMKYEMEKLNRLLGNLSSDKIHSQASVFDLKEAINQAKQAEIFQLKEQLKNAHLRLDGALEELKELNEKHHFLLEKMEVMRRSSNLSSLDNSTNDADLFKRGEDLDSTLTISTCSDWSIADQPPFTAGFEVPNRGSSRKLSWKFKGKDNLNARLTLEKCKSMDSDHSINSVGFPDSNVPDSVAAPSSDESEDEALTSEQFGSFGTTETIADTDGNNNDKKKRKNFDGEVFVRAQKVPSLTPTDLISEATGV